MEHSKDIFQISLSLSLSLSLSFSLSLINTGYSTSNYNSPRMFFRNSYLNTSKQKQSSRIKGAVGKDCPVADVSLSIDTETRVVIVALTWYFFFSNFGFYTGTRNPFQTQSEWRIRDVAMVQVSYRYIFLLVCYRYLMKFWNTHPGRCSSYL